jgi:hypothetical protein
MLHVRSHQILLFSEEFRNLGTWEPYYGYWDAYYYGIIRNLGTPISSVTFCRGEIHHRLLDPMRVLKTSKTPAKSA